jgi:hypothetical protein
MRDAAHVAAAALLLAAGLAGCGGVAGSSTAGGPPLRTLPASDYVLRLDELPDPGFAIVSPVSAVDATTLAGGDSARLSLFHNEGLEQASSARYFRAVPSLATSNGPIDVTSTVERFGTAAGAHRAFGDQVTHDDSLSGSTALSAGAIADEGHATLLTTAAADGTPLSQTTLVWRSVNLVCVLVVRQRLAGSPLQAALLLATPQLARQGVATPAPRGG